MNSKRFYKPENWFRISRDNETSPGTTILTPKKVKSGMGSKNKITDWFYKTHLKKNTRFFMMDILFNPDQSLTGLPGKWCLRYEKTL